MYIINFVFKYFIFPKLPSLISIFTPNFINQKNLVQESIK